MDLSARGKKRVCIECNEPFYDLNRDPAPCPACGRVHSLEAFITGKRTPVPVAAVKKPEDIADNTDNDDDDDAVIGNDDIDDDDDDGLAVVTPIVAKVNNEE